MSAICDAIDQARPARKRRLEDKLQAQIITYLRLALPDCIIFAVPNGGSRSSAIEGANLKRLGLLAGVPDLAIVQPGSIVRFIEVKSPTGRTQPEQQAMHAAFAAKGIFFAVVRSLADVEAALFCWGIKESRK